MSEFDHRLSGATKSIPTIGPMRPRTSRHWFASISKIRFSPGSPAAYLGDDQEYFFTLANQVIPKPGCKGSGGGWHRDTAQERQFKSILYVVDVDETTGPFEYVPKSHHVRSIVGTILNSGVRFGQYQFTEDEIQRDSGRMPHEARARLTAKAGTVVLADTSGLHRGNPISAVRSLRDHELFLRPRKNRRTPV